MNTRHYSEDELILHHYGEDGRARSDIARHLEHCERCQTAYRQLADTLALVAAPEAPERGDQYGLEVWQRIRHQLPDRDEGWWSGWNLVRWPNDRLRLAGAVAALVVLAFVAGRVWPREPAQAPVATNATNTQAREASGSALPVDEKAQARQRILLSAVADHFDKSERVLTDIMNAQSRDISAEQGWADDLLTTSRLYRKGAEEAGEPFLADVLDELERSLLEIVHSPSHISASALEQLRVRIDAATLLFKVRVMSDELRRRGAPPLDRDAAPPSMMSTAISQS